MKQTPSVPDKDLSTQSSHSSREEHNAWNVHEHVTDQMQLEAQRLLETAGTPELAKHALEEVEEQRVAHVHDDFAISMGYMSFDVLVLASESFSKNGGKPWHVTPLPNGQWVVWTENAISQALIVPLREEALRHIETRSG